jgi:hypothetical protein
LAKILSTFSCCKSCMKQFPSTSEKDEWRCITGWKPYKMALGKRLLTLSSWRDRCFTNWLQTGSVFFLNTFYKTMNALVWFHKIVIMAVDQNHPMQLTGNTIS